VNHEYDIILDILVINRTTLTLTNLTVDLATKGPIKIVERAQSHTLAPGSSLKVSLYEEGIFL
jgi:coatomer subunit beta